MSDPHQRLDRLRALMREQDVGTTLFSIGPDLPYLTGYLAMPSERVTMLVVPAAADPVLVVPRLEAPRVDSNLTDVLAWDETDDPMALIASRCEPDGRIAIGDQTWSVFLVRLMEHLETDWKPASELMRALRQVKDETEISALRAAGQAVDRVLARVPDEVRFSDRTEAEVAADLRMMTVEEGHDEASSAIVASGPNGASPHHDPGSRKLSRGDVVVCDFGGTVDGYHSDVTRTFAVGEPGQEAVEVHTVVAAASMAGRSAVRPGVACQEVDRASRRVITEAGYGEHFIHRTGHGIGLEVHEHPYIVEGNEERLQPGMTFSIEPGIYLPGRLGVRIEDIVACVDDGVDVLNNADRGLVVVA